jgi:hypothetical protein
LCKEKGQGLEHLHFRGAAAPAGAGKMLYPGQHAGEMFLWHDRSLFDAGKFRFTQLRHGLTDIAVIATSFCG